MASIYGDTLGDLSRNEIAQQQADAAERNAYRNFISQVAQRRLAEKEQADFGQFRREDLGVRRELGLGQTAAYRDVGLGQSSAYRDVGLGQSGAYRDVGMANADTHKVVGLKNAEALMKQADNILEASKYGSDAQKVIAQTQAEALKAQAKAHLDAAGITAGAQERIANAGYGNQLALATLNLPVTWAQAGALGAQTNLLNAQAGAITKGAPTQQQQLLDASTAADNDKEARGLWAKETQKLLDAHKNETTGWLGGMWDSNSPSTQKIDALIKTGLTKEQAAMQVARDNIAPMYPASSLFRNAVAARAAGADGSNIPNILPPATDRGTNIFNGKSNPVVLNQSRQPAAAAAQPEINAQVESVYGNNPFARSAYSQRLQQSLGNSGAVRITDTDRNVDYTVPQEEWNRLFPSLKY